MLVEIRRIDPPGARHSEVEYHRVATICVDESIFGTPPQIGDPGTRQPLPKVGRECTAKVGPARLDPPDLAALEHMAQSSNGGFDFGQLWHSLSLRGTL